MTNHPFTDQERELLKSLNRRVMFNLPNIKEFPVCLITGPAVAELAINTHLSDLDQTFIIFAPDQNTYDTIKDHIRLTGTSIRDYETSTKFIIKYMKWFNLKKIDLIAEEYFVSFISKKNLIVSRTNVYEYPNKFVPHPIYCFSGKCYVSRSRLDEAKNYVGNNDSI